MHPWFLLNVNSIYVSLFFLFITSLAYIYDYFKKPNKTIAVLFIALLYLWLARDANLYGFINALVNYIIVVSLISLRKNILTSCLSFIVKALAIILFVSMICYVLYLFHVPLPHTTIVMGENSLFSTLENYYTFVFIKNSIGATRFFSIFLEPGYLTLGIAPLLFLYKYNVRNKYIAILLAAQILSFSLAGIILLAFGLTYCVLLGSGKGRILTLFKSLLVITIFCIPLYNVLGREYFDEKIFNRLEIVNGKLAGDDRYSLSLEHKYDKLIESSDKWIGTYYDTKSSESGNSGYKLFVVQHGVIGLLLVVLSYLSFISKWKKFNYEAGLVVLCLLMLSQNSYPTAACVIFPVICGSSVFNES